MDLLNWLHTPVLPKPGWRLLIGVLLAGGITAFFWTPLHLQLWNDEVYSLLYFQRVAPLRTLTDYHETNNHILFNALQNLWIRGLGSPPVSELLQTPWKLRLLPLCYAIVTCLTMAFGLLRRNGPGIAMLGLALLLCSIPYYNFALQGRAYGLLIMLGTLQLFGLLRYLEKGGRRRLWAGALWAFLIFYAHPAGLYLVIGWILAAGICFSSDLRKPDLTRQRAYYAIGAWICGLFLAGLAYLPVMDQLLHNPWVRTHSVSFRTFFHDTFLSVLRQLTGGNTLILLLIAALVFGSRLLRNAPAERRVLLYCVMVVICSYVMPLLRLDEVPQRTYTMLIPYIAIGLAVAMAGVLRCFPKTPALICLAPLFTIVLICRFPASLERRDRRIEAAIREGRELSSIEAAYYQHRFNPLETVLQAQRASVRKRLPVYAAIAYRQELPHYLEAFSMPWLEYRSPTQRAALPDSALIISSMLPEFRRRYQSELNIQVLDSTGGFYELLQVRKRK